MRRILHLSPTSPLCNFLASQACGGRGLHSAEFAYTVAVLRNLERLLQVVHPHIRALTLKYLTAAVRAMGGCPRFILKQYPPLTKRNGPTIYTAVLAAIRMTNAVVLLDKNSCDDTTPIILPKAAMHLEHPPQFVKETIGGDDAWIVFLPCTVAEPLLASGRHHLGQLVGTTMLLPSTTLFPQADHTRECPSYQYLKKHFTDGRLCLVTPLIRERHFPRWLEYTTLAAPNPVLPTQDTAVIAPVGLKLRIKARCGPYLVDNQLAVFVTDQTSCRWCVACAYPNFPFIPAVLIRIMVSAFEVARTRAAPYALGLVPNRQVADLNPSHGQQDTLVVACGRQSYVQPYFCWCCDLL